MTTRKIVSKHMLVAFTWLIQCVFVTAQETPTWYVDSDPMRGVDDSSCGSLEASPCRTLNHAVMLVHAACGCLDPTIRVPCGGTIQLAHGRYELSAFSFWFCTVVHR